MANGPKQLKRKLLTEARIAREAKYKSQRTVREFQGKKYLDKLEKEKMQESLDEMVVEDMVKVKTFENATMAFYWSG